nr:oxidoreductase ops5 [Quercus suber]
MIIHGPTDAHYDEDLGPVMLSDWFHRYYYDIVEQVMAPASKGLPPPFSNNNLINGKMNYPCAKSELNCTANAGISTFHFTAGKTYRLRLINSGAEATQKFSIDGHKLTVIANDFVEIVPYTTDVVTLGIGQRSDVLVTASGKPTDAVWMRSVLGPCTLADGVSPVAFAAVYYQDANTTAVPTTQTSITAAEIANCNNDALELTRPLYPIAPPPHPQSVQQVNLTYQNNGTHNLFYMNNSPFRTNYNDPVLLDAKLGHNDYPAEYNVYNFGSSKSIQIVLYNYAPPIIGTHPMHIHGHNMYILAMGTGIWDGKVVNPHNPQRRDVQVLPGAASPTVPGYIVIQIDADNPGVWPFHCHIAWHVSAGLYINILERPDEIQKDMRIPSTNAQSCRDWSAWTGTHIPDQIDSGL